MSRMDDYLDLIDRERESRPAEAMLADEIKLLRDVLVFADGFVVSQTINDEYPMALADLYNETCDAAGAIQRAGCHPRGKFRQVDVPDGD